MTTDVEKTEIAQQFLDGLRNRDWDLLKSIMTDDIVWSLPGRSLISGEARGAEAVIKRSQLIVSYGLTFSLKNILLGQHGVALSLNNTVDAATWCLMNIWLQFSLFVRGGYLRSQLTCPM